MQMRPLIPLLIPLLLTAATGHSATRRWTPEEAWDWYKKEPWLVGANYLPSSAINQLEMWQADTFDPKTIDRELGWAHGIGMNVMRVFLHDIAWKEDPEGFFKRVDEYLAISDKHGVGTCIVIFDSVWDPEPKAGKQPDPKPGLHNSGWVQSPGSAILGDPARHDSLKPYVQAVVKRYGKDKRVVMWDLMNEAENPNGSSYAAKEPKDKQKHALALLEKTFAWAREMDPQQPLSACVWGDFLKNRPIDRFMLDHSDVVNFHTYDDLPKVREQLALLKKEGRPLICTEYMARPQKNTFEIILPLFQEENVAAINWGFVNGKSQTIYPWDSWKKAYTKEPDVWFHDVFQTDGRPYREPETTLIKKLTSEKNRK